MRYRAIFIHSNLDSSTPNAETVPTTAGVFLRTDNNGTICPRMGDQRVSVPPVQLCSQNDFGFSKAKAVVAGAQTEEFQAAGQEVLELECLGPILPLHAARRIHGRRRGPAEQHHKRANEHPVRVPSETVADPPHEAGGLAGKRFSELSQASERDEAKDLGASSKQP